MNDWQAIDSAISQAIGRQFVSQTRRGLAGGDINEAFCLTSGARRYFVKRNRAEYQAMFEAEADGLDELRQAVGLRVPEVVCHGLTERHAFLVLEFIDLRTPTRAAFTRMGEALADMHGIVRSQHGWDRDNAIGANPQHNTPHAQWSEFWRENRLAVMLDALAPSHPQLAREGDMLLGVLGDLLAGHVPEASLLHGDFWGGNVSMDTQGVPVIYDPAVYYGDRETDLALAELFGGFAPVFFEAYWGAWPAQPGYREIRRPLYQLYHLLNHARLFGTHYVAQSRELIARLRAAL